MPDASQALSFPGTMPSSNGLPDTDERTSPKSQGQRTAADGRAFTLGGSTSRWCACRTTAYEARHVRSAQRAR